MKKNITMKKVATIILSLFITIELFGGEKTLIYSDHEPYGNMRTTFIKEVFFKEVENQTNGSIKIDTKWDSEIAKGYDALKSITEENKADLAVIVPEYMEKLLPLHQLFKSFPVGPTGNNQVKFLREVYKNIPELNEELDKNNVHAILIATGYPVAFFGKQPINTVEEIKGKTWRSASFWQRDQIKNFGGNAITMPWGEKVIQALNDGTIDGLMVNIDSAVDLGINKIAPYGVVSKDLWLGHIYIIAINKDTWNSLSNLEKEAINRAAEIAYSKLGDIMDENYDSMLKKVTETGGKAIREFTKQEVENWLKNSNYENYQIEWAKQKEAEGTKNIISTLEKLKKEIKPYINNLDFQIK